MSNTRVIQNKGPSNLLVATKGGMLSVPPYSSRTVTNPVEPTQVYQATDLPTQKVGFGNSGIESPSSGHGFGNTNQSIDPTPTEKGWSWRR